METGEVQLTISFASREDAERFQSAATTDSDVEATLQFMPGMDSKILVGPAKSGTDVECFTIFEGGADQLRSLFDIADQAGGWLSAEPDCSPALTQIVHDAAAEFSGLNGKNRPNQEAPKSPAAVSEDDAATTRKKSGPSKELARELWERLAKSRPGPDNKDLIFLARFVPLLSGAAVKTLLGRKVTLEELKELIQYVPVARTPGTKLILKKFADELDEEDMRFIFTQTKSAEIGKYLLKHYPNDANLGLVERTVDDLTDVVAKIRQQEPTKTVLREIDRKL